MEPSTRDPRDLRSRRWIGRLVRVGLVMLAIVVAGSWIGRRVSHKARRMGNIRVVNVPASDINTLGTGDFRIFNRDSAVELVLRGNQVLAGLSPKTVAKIQGEMQKSATKDSSGLGGIIASTVKSAVAGTIGIHAAYSVTDIEDMRYE